MKTPSRTVPFDLNRCVGAVLSSLSNRLSSGASQEYRARFDIGVVEWRVLCQLATDTQATGAQLSAALGLDKGLISRSLALLDERELVTIRADGGRRRAAMLTDAGRAMLDRVLQVAHAREDRLLAGLADSEVDMLLTLLQRLLANLPGVEKDAAQRLSTPRLGPAPKAAGRKVPAPSSP